MSESDTIRIDIPASYTYLNVLGLCLQGVLERVEGLSDRASTIYNIQLAAHEICTNIVGHAYADQSGRIAITIVLMRDPLRVVIELCDSGRPFDPSQVPAPDLDTAQVHGYGLFLVHSLMDDVSYEGQASRNRWCLVKHLSITIKSED